MISLSLSNFIKTILNIQDDNISFPEEDYCQIIQKGIMTLGKEELKHIFEEEKEIEAQCQFCGKKYKFTEKDFDDVLKK